MISHSLRLFFSWGLLFCTLALAGTTSHGKTLQEVVSILGDSSRSVDERMKAGAEIVQNLGSPNGPVLIYNRDHDLIAKHSLTLLNGSDDALRKLGTHLFLALPPTEYDNAALESLATRANELRLSVSLIAAKGLTTPTAAQVLKAALSKRPDTVSFQLATTEAIKRQTPGLKDDLVAALADQRAGIQMIAAQALTELPKGTELPREVLRKHLVEAESRLRKREELEKYLPQTGAPAPPTQEQRLDTALRTVLQTPTKHIPSGDEQSAAEPKGQQAGITATAKTEPQDLAITLPIPPSTDVPTTSPWIWALSVLVLIFVAWLLSRILRRR